MTNLIVLCFGELPIQEKQTTSTLPPIHHLPLRDNWLTSALDWIEHNNPAALLVPRFWAEHEYGDMPNAPSILRKKDRAYVVPGAAPSGFEESEAGFAAWWQGLMPLILTFPVAVFPLNYVFDRPEPGASIAFHTFLNELSKNSDRLRYTS